MSTRRLLPFLAVISAVALAGSAHAVAPAATPPTATATPKPNWLPADKQGFGTSHTLASKVWFTLQGGSLSEVYYPTLDTPSFRDLEFTVDGVNERDGSVHRAALADPRSLTYEQINTDKRHRWRLTKIYLTDPARSTVMVDVQFQSLDGRRHRVANPGRCRAVERGGSRVAGMLAVRGPGQRSADGDRIACLAATRRPAKAPV